MWKSVEMLNFISPLSLAQRVQPQSLSQGGEFFCWLVFPCFHFLCSVTSSQSHTICASAHTAVNRILEWIFHIRTEVEQLCWKGCKCSSEELSFFFFLLSTTWKSSLLTVSGQGERELWHHWKRLLRVSLRRLSQFPWCWTCSVLRECFAYRKVFGTFPQH